MGISVGIPMSRPMGIWYGKRLRFVLTVFGAMVNSDKVGHQLERPSGTLRLTLLACR